MTTVTAPAPAAPAAATRLRAGALSTTGITFMVLSATAPLSILLGGLGAPAGYLAAAIAMGCFAYGFNAMTRYVARPGAFYAYVDRGLGRRAGAGAGVLALLAYNGIQISSYAILGTSTSAALDLFLGISAHWTVPAFAGIALVWFLGYRGVTIGARVLGVLLVAEAVILAVVAVAVIGRGGADGLSFTSFTPSATFTAGMAAALTVCLGSFLGFESTAIYRAEARDPERSVPRATIAALAFLGLFYTVVVWAVIQAYGDAGALAAAEGQTADMVYVVAERFVGAGSADLMRILIVTSVLASSLAFHNAVNRYTHSLALQGMLPRRLAATHPVHQSPYVAGAWQIILAALVVVGFAIAGSDPYLTMLMWLNTPGIIGIVVLQALTAVAVVVFFARRRDAPRRAAILAVSAFSVLLMGAAVAIMVAKVDIITGAGAWTNTVLVGLVPVVFLLGVLRCGHRAPDVASAEDPVA